MIYLYYMLCLVTALVFHWAIFAIIVLAMFFLTLLSAAWDATKPNPTRRYAAPPARPRSRR